MKTWNPLSTYRLQLHKDFPFRALDQIRNYLAALGLGAVYVSPVFKAVPGSQHGYDGTDPLSINPEIGTLEEMQLLSSQLRTSGIGWLQDIAPNHMAFHQDNAWLMGVLARGASSAYEDFFDTDRQHPDFNGKLMVPVLNESTEEAITQQKLQLAWQNGAFMLRCHEYLYPLNPDSVASLSAEGTAIQVMDRYNGQASLLKDLLDRQHYLFCHWSETDWHLNYRRFFTVNSLLCLNMQHPQVFNTWHRLVQRLLQDQTVQGLRVDHIDGLAEPGAYLEDLRRLAGPDPYLSVEKILGPQESLPASWPIQGSTGYDFLRIVNQLLSVKSNEKKFTQLYRQITGNRSKAQQQLFKKKQWFLRQHMQGELDNLERLYLHWFPAVVSTEEDRGQLRQAIEAILVYCPVYRFYSSRSAFPGDVHTELTQLFRDIRDEQPGLERGLALLEHTWLHTGHAADHRPYLFFRRCMQFTGPLMAKGLEDTLMYTYNRFIGHNEVGDHPQQFGMSRKHFHRLMQQRQEQWPLSLNATATHDTKRGEDVRARLSVLTELPDEWARLVQRWREENAAFKDQGMPDANDEYFIYQTIAGAYPFGKQEREAFPERLKAYLTKALREAKVHSHWTSPNLQYEDATHRFVLKLLDTTSSFSRELENFLSRITDFGLLNSLVQLVLKCTCPGVPDIYQGNELWDFSLVDPDNRRPVDYDSRLRILENLPPDPNDETATELWHARHNGGIKLWLTRLLLKERRTAAAVFSEGDYLPLEVKGPCRDHVLAFARRLGDQWYVVALPLHTARLCRQQQQESPLDIDWGPTRILLPEQIPAQWEHLLWTASGHHRKSIAVKELFGKLPLALLRFRPAGARSAGVLLHISSLPSPFGTGDLGSGARRFADFLSDSGQRIWQVLPLNPLSAGNHYSPYSSVSSFAGNPAFISPEEMQREGLLRKEDWEAYTIAATGKADYQQAMEAKQSLCNLSLERFQKDLFPALEADFATFQKKAAYWLEDYALYLLLKQAHHDLPWFRWPEPLKWRNPAALRDFKEHRRQELQQIYWQQFLFDRHWHALRQYCQRLGIRLFGDLPFYISHDSADVWTHPSIFCLDEEGLLSGIAGVPPDYFSANGQLWGMPTFNWDELKRTGYHWWLQRLRNNLDRFDLLRLDHFRAFAEYWEVPAGESTARYGQWKKGPGAVFFDVVRQELGHLPFVAEDLGDSMEAVYLLRDQARLPGMKVLQFAFNEQLPCSVDAPHNYRPDCVVYTGTHDNNTVAGWYHDETSAAGRALLRQYTGLPVHAGNIHWLLIRLAYASVAETAIVPMQDLLGLGEESRMNTPGTTEGNWLWRMKADALQEPLRRQLMAWTHLYNRR